MMKTFRCIDLETTGMDPPEEILEVGITDLIFDVEACDYQIGETSSWLFRPSSGVIPPQTKGVHHITEEDVAGKSICQLLDLQRIIRFNEPDFIVAHNNEFEKKWLTAEVTGERMWICTEKVARWVFKTEAPDFKLQTLRYWMETMLEPERAMPPHRAGPDSYVNAHVLGQLLCLAKVRDMVGWTRAPKLILTCPIGEHYGKPWKEVPTKYLEWMIGKDFDDDLKWNVRAELDLRRGHGA